MKNNKRKSGFTLVELLVVIAILAILATVSVVGYTAFIKRAHESNAQAEAHQVEEAIYAELIVAEDGVFKLGSANNTEYYITNKVSGSTGWVVATLTDSTYSKASKDADITNYIKAATFMNGDFAGLDGKFTVDDNGNILYTVTYDNGTASATINFND